MNREGSSGRSESLRGDQSGSLGTWRSRLSATSLKRGGSPLLLSPFLCRMHYIWLHLPRLRRRCNSLMEPIYEVAFDSMSTYCRVLEQTDTLHWTAYLVAFCANELLLGTRSFSKAAMSASPHTSTLASLSTPRGSHWRSIVHPFLASLPIQPLGCFVALITRKRSLPCWH